MMDPVIATVLKYFTFAFYLIGIVGFFSLLVSGAYLLIVSYKLCSIAYAKGYGVRIQCHTNRSHCDHRPYDLECGISQQDLDASQVLRKLRVLALFTPLLTLVSMAAIFVTLVSSAEVPNGMASFLTVFTVVILHAANAFMVNSYFDLVAEYSSKISFEPDIRSPRYERVNSTGLTRMYITALLVLCNVRDHATYVPIR